MTPVYTRRALGLREYSYSRWTDRSLHLCFRTPRARFPRTRLLSHMPVVISTLPVARPTSWACDLRFDAFPSRGIAPSRHSVGLALLQRYSLRSRAYDRPHVSLSEAFLSASASCGIPPDTPCGWHLLPLRRESTYRVTPFPGPIVRIRRTVRSTGGLGRAHRSVIPAAGAVSSALLAPACPPLALGRFDEGSSPLR